MPLFVTLLQHVYFDYLLIVHEFEIMFSFLEVINMFCFLYLVVVVTCVVFLICLCFILQLWF